MSTATKKSKTKGVKVTLSAEKSEELFHSALCNGIREFPHYGLQLDYKINAYNKAKKSLQEKINKGIVPIGVFVLGDEKPTICREDIWVEILRNDGELKVIDNENGGEYNRSIKLADVHKRVQRSPMRHLWDAITEEGDAVTADVILQQVFFDDVIFG